MRMTKATVPTETVGGTIDAGQEAIMEILVDRLRAIVFGGERGWVRTGWFTD
jgi:hypothetical protein